MNVDQADENGLIDWALADLNQYEGTDPRKLDSVLDHILGYSSIRETTPRGNWLETLEVKLIRNGASPANAGKVANSPVTREAFRQSGERLLTRIKGELESLPLNFLLHLREPFPTDGPSFKTLCEKVSENAASLAQAIIDKLGDTIKITAIREKTHFESALRTGGFDHPDRISSGIASYKKASIESGAKPDQDLIEQGLKEATHKAISSLVEKPVNRNDFYENWVAKTYDRPKTYGYGTEPDTIDVQQGIFCVPYKVLLQLLRYYASFEDPVPQLTKVPLDLIPKIQKFITSIRELQARLFPDDPSQQVLQTNGDDRNGKLIHSALMRLFEKLAQAD
jgi:hypothetical protein